MYVLKIQRSCKDISLFSDYLKSHPEAIKLYSQVKKEGARLFPDNIEKYLEYKSDCISELYKKCGLIK